MSNEAARYNWLPFSDKHRRTPALWGRGQGSHSFLARLSGQASLTRRCDARLTPNAQADSLNCTLPGPSNEVVP